MRILLLSDSHGAFPKNVEPYFTQVDEIWHAGDVGPAAGLDYLRQFKPVRAVYGNIDGTDVRKQCAEFLHFSLQGLSFFMMHIVGRPGKYNAQALRLVQLHKPNVVVCGHSHIALVSPGIYPGSLHLNPGAIGNQGWHHAITALRFQVETGRIFNMELIDLGPRGQEQPMLFF
jgi:putative phosphoesterase